MVLVADEIPKLSKRKLKSLVKNEEKTAIAANLVYVLDTEPGITRKKRGDEFTYYFDDKPLKDDEDLVRIKGLAIPPAWTNVWICKKENGHLQATGYDARDRKQYRYHPNWNMLRTHTKFYRMISFGKALPKIRKALEKDLRPKELTVAKVLAAVVSLMERTNIRIGNSAYEKENGSFGLTTLKDRHVTFEGSAVKFSFKGKKGIRHQITLKNKRLANIVKLCRDVPGKELFQFYDDNGNHHSIDSGMVNHYIKEISGENFTAKDFRTWAGTVAAFLALKKLGCCDTKTQAKKHILEAVDIVSNQLGNTRTVSKKYYVHPVILTLYETGELKKYFNDLDKAEKSSEPHGLTTEENIVMKILESN